SDDDFPAIAKRNAVSLAELICEDIAAHAKLRLQGALRVVNPRMDHTAVARTGQHADLRKRFEHKHIAMRLRNSPGNRAADHAAANDYNVRLIHSISSRMQLQIAIKRFLAMLSERRPLR